MPSPEEWAKLVADQLVAIDRTKAAAAGYLVGAFFGGMQAALKEASSSGRVGARRRETCQPHATPETPPTFDPEEVAREAEDAMRQGRASRRRA
jgi:hypothetical protein